MPTYEVTQTANTEVWAKNEMEAIEIVTGEFFAFPEYRHEVKETTEPEMIADLGEIADTLTRMGHKATIQTQSWRGMPAYLEIDETEALLIDGQPHTDPRFTLYYNLNENGDDISGTGYHLSFKDDEAQIVSEIGNESALRVVAEIIKGMARAEMQLENGFN